MRQILRQIVAVLALVGLSMNLVPSALAATSYTDVSAANKLANAGIIVDHSAKTADYRLNDTVLRQEAVKVVAGALGGILENEANYTCTGMFSDIARGTWVCRIAELARNAGLVAANPTFRPVSKLSRLEAVIFALRSAELMPAGDHSTDAILGFAVDAGLITSAAGFSANAAATRGEFFRYVAKALDAAELPDICTLAPDLCGNGNGGNNGNNSGAVSVSLSAGQPNTTLVAGQSGAVLANITFTGNGTVTAVNLTQAGVSADTTLSNVYLFDGATRLTDAATVSSGRKIDFVNGSGIFTVNGSKTISVVAEIATLTSGQTVGVNLSGFKVGTNNSTSANLMGNIVTIASADLASASFATPTPTGGSIDPAKDVEVFKTNVSVGTRDLVLSRLAIRQIGSVNNNDIVNFRLQVDGQTVSTVANLDINGYATFSINPSKTLQTGTRVIRVLADVNGGSSRTFQFSVRNKSDVGLSDSQYNVGINPTTFPASTGAVTINSGSVTIQKAIGSTTGDITVNGNDVVLAKYTVTTYGEPLKIENLKAGFTYNGAPGATNNAAATLRNGRILINGAQVGSTTTLVAAGTTFTTNYTLAAGVPTTIEIRADLFDNDGTGVIDASDTITASLLAPAAANTQRLTSLGYISVPSVDTAGNQLTAKSAASVTMTKTSTYANQTTAIPQTQSYKIASYSLAGNSSEDVNVDTVSVDFAAASGTTFTSADLTDVILKVDGVAVGTPKATVSATGNSYSVSFVLPKNGSKTIELWANIGSTITATHAVQATTTLSGVGASSSVTSTTGAVAGQTITANTGTLTITADASRPVAALWDDAGTRTAAAFKFDAATDSYNVTDLTLTIASTSAVSMVKLYDGTTLVATKPAATTVTFNGLTWNVPANTSKVLRVELDVGAVGVGAGTSGSDATVTLTAATATNGAGTSGLATESDPAGNVAYVYKAVPTVTNVALPTSALSTGTQTVSKFTVGTNGTGTIGWKKVIFNVTRSIGGTDTLSNVTLWDADSNTQITGTPTFTGSVDADNGTAGTIVFVATDEQQIAGAKTYVLKLDVAGTLATGNNINVNIAQQASYAAPAAYATVAGTSSSFVWTDVSAATHSATTTDWSNDYLLKNLPTDSQTLSKS